MRRQILRRFYSSPSLIALALILVCTLGVVNWLRLSHVEDAAIPGPVSSAYRQAPMQMPLRQSALFVGDDFISWSQGFYTYPFMVCDAFALNCNVDAQPGTGFLSNSQTYSNANLPLIDRLPKDRAIYDADLIIIDAGRNDLPAGVEAFGRALATYLEAVRGDWPDAKIVVLVPWLMSNEQDPSYAEIAAVVRQETEMVDGVWIDPVQEGWFNDVDVSMLQVDDNLHPNQAGHTLIAKKLTESLEQHGLMERRATTQ